VNNIGEEQIKKIQEKIKRTMDAYDMYADNHACTIVVGLSGGADSLMLVHYLKNNFRVTGGKLIAAHVNHGLRGSQADADEQFVKEWCAQNEVPLKVLHADIRTRAQASGKGLEECGRDVRYEFFYQLACGDQDKIVTAHTLSDSSETVLLNLARGTGTKGLCGIPPARGKIIRPLIAVTRAEVEQYCAYYQLHYVTDKTNFSREYSRNKIRLDVVPILKQLNPAFESAVLRMTQQLAQDEDCLVELARQGMQAARRGNSYCTKAFVDMHPAVRARAIMLAVQNLCKVRLSSEHIHAVSDMLCCGHGAVTVAGNVNVSVEGELFFISRGNTQGKRLKEKKNCWSTPFVLPQTLTEGGRTVIITVMSKIEYKNQYKINNLLFNNAIDYDTITNNMNFRNRREGDSFTPAGRGVTKSIKKLFNESKIPPSARDHIMMLESNGHIIWMEGFGASQSSCVNPDTQNIALIFIKESLVDVR